MKILLENFAPIHRFEFDLEKDFSIIFGKNNIGKSYAITAVYLILKNLKETKPHHSFYKNLDFLNFYKQEKKINNIGITLFFKKLVLSDFLKNLENSFKNSFFSFEHLSNKISKLPFKITIDLDGFSFEIIEEDNHLDITNIIVKNKYLQKIEIIDDSSISSFFRRMLSFWEKIQHKIQNIYFLPASRSGLYQALNAFGAIMVELSKSRSFLTKKIELPTISEPVSDYFLNLSKISNHNTALTQIVEKIETEILKGKIVFNQQTNKIAFIQDNLDFELDLAFASSMVAEIAPIVAHLKFIIDNSDNTKNSSNIIFIEEPEAHLHPEIQVKLLEIFCNMMDFNIKIVMTTHSNYMFNKLSNLILDKKVDYKRVDSQLMIPTEKGSIIDKKNMFAEEEGIEDKNFLAIAEQLYEERIRIYDKLNQE